MGQLDDGPVGPADVLARAALGAQARDHLDDEVDLVGQQGVQVHEGIAAQRGQFDVGGEMRVVGQTPTVAVEQFP